MNLRIPSPSTVVADFEVESVTMPGVSGELTAMQGHDTLLALLKPGGVRCVRRKSHEGKTEDEFEIGPGLVEVIHDQVTVCVSHAERRGEGENPKGGKVEGRTR